MHFIFWAELILILFHNNVLRLFVLESQYAFYASKLADVFQARSWVGLCVDRPAMKHMFNTKVSGVGAMFQVPCCAVMRPRTVPAMKQNDDLARPNR
jgi:hypothetical protein